MNVKELIEWLSKQDQEAIVEVVSHTPGLTYYDQGGNAYTVEFDPDKGEYYKEHWEYTDFRGNQFVKENDPFYNKRYLLLGQFNG